MITLTISVSGYLIINNMSKVLQDKEIKFEGEALKKLQSYTADEYDKIFKIVFQMNYPGGVGEVLAVTGNLQDKLYSNDNNIRRIKDYLSTICSYDENITDFIVVTNDSTVFYDTGLPKQGRTAVASYPFLEDPTIEDVRDNKIFIKAIRDNPSRYIHKGSDDVVSFVGNIYDPAHIEKKQSVGAYIINVSLHKFYNSYMEYESSVKGDFVISNDEGNVLFSSNNNFTLDNGINLSTAVKLMSKQPNEVKLLGKRYIYHRMEVGSTPLSVTNYIPKDLLWEYGKRSIWEVFWVLLASLATTLVLLSFIAYVYSNRINLLVKYMKRIKEGNFTSRVHLRSEDEIGKLAVEFNDMSQKLSDYIERVYSAEIEQKSAEINALQAQVNPHFLYNTLESIRMQALKEHNPNIAEMISQLGNLFRWSVKTSNKVVEMEQEVYYITTYLELQKMRFKDRLNVDINIAQEVMRLGIPKLLLQPLIENVFVHAIGDGAEKLSILIKGTRHDANVIITIQDNGSGFDSSTLARTQKQMAGLIFDEDTHIGIANVNSRIRLIFGKAYGLFIDSVEGFGTTIQLRFPAMTTREMQSHVQNTHR
ncbi:sensor histidine kinase [Cohnella endophytica]|nr:histidine kinase [Cohnella endophytica]